MSNRITNIETEISNTLEGIDGTAQSTYMYKTNTGTIQVYDEVLSLGRNLVHTTNDYESVNHQFDQQEDVGVEGQDWSTGQKTYSNRMVYVLKSKVHNVGSESANKQSPKNAIREKMYDCLMDLLYAFGENHQLNGQVSWIRFLGAYPDYDDITNNRIQSGTLISQWEVQFNQSFSNPDIPSCW